MDLTACYKKIIGRLNRRAYQAQVILTTPKLTPWELRFLSESLLSNIWLDWNEFTKSILMASCNGSLDRSGNTIMARPSINTEERIRYEFKKYSNGGSPNASGVDFGPLEPTWAHSQYVIPAIQGLAPGNSSRLQSAYGNATLVGHKRIHAVRNATAHKSRHNRIDIAALRANYITEHYLDPIDIIWGFDKHDRSKIAIFQWLEDLIDIADIATS